jgi:hypothetical protein
LVAARTIPEKPIWCFQERARDVVDRGTPELQQAVEHGKVSVSAAADVATRPQAPQLYKPADGFQLGIPVGLAAAR